LVGRRVLCPPYTGALGLLIWGVDHWNYVNGNAILRGVSLTELNSEELLDVLHYFFEIDNQASTAEEVEAKSNLRTSMYRIFYDKNYKQQYRANTTGYNNSSRTTASGIPVDGYVGQDVDDPLATEKGPTKPFVPATEFNPDSPVPFGPVLDPPAG